MGDSHLKRSGVGGGGGHDDAVAHSLLLGEQTHELGDSRPLLADTDVPVYMLKKEEEKNMTISETWREGGVTKRNERQAGDIINSASR